MQGWIFLRKKIYFSPWNLVILHDTCNIFVIIAKKDSEKVRSFEYPKYKDTESTWQSFSAG